MSSSYGAVREYRDDPSAPSSRAVGYQSGGSASIQELCDQISSNIFQINNGANTIERAMKSIGTKRDTPMIRDKIHEVSTNVSKVVKDTTRLIRSASATAMRGDRQQKMQVQRLSSGFQESVSRFQTLQKEAMEKVKAAAKLGGTQSDASKPPDNTAEVGGADDRQRLLEDNPFAQLQAQKVVIEDDLSLLQEREERIRQLESDILDVNEIFRDLGAMVTEQGGMLDEIEDNVVRVVTDVESANKDLGKAAEFQKRSRKKMCCLLVLLLVIVIIIVLVVVLSVN
ncbi:syntaxin-7-like [Babylonia areolata]|uniref:syntaxin-7-like n=1 Tax=Babylonia areolata TaxID=304850 RepID=UPI003FD6AA9D